MWKSGLLEALRFVLESTDWQLLTQLVKSLGAPASQRLRVP